MRTRSGLAILAIIAISAFSAVHGQNGASAAEQQLFASVNRERRVRGLPPLRWSDPLATAARRHAGLMAQRGQAEHGFTGEPSLPSRATQAGARFISLAENVAQGPGVEVIQSEFLRSANHRANMMDTDMDSIGVGVIERGGQLFAVEDFSKAK